ncbi:hypothetical protein [Actinophytocola sp.]|uniref:hypothetical protein n=1 Tax=Actinophytocola sp. TaxID=1872138 RepID=UPI002D43B990|nr:hypothetical protein [Actinophytocola sp.]HYQ66165.1 hypothetical protein [Actinophytocola sp.]
MTYYWWSRPSAWTPEEDNGELHVTGTHDVDTARQHAATFLARNLDLTSAQTTAMLTGSPRRWWALPSWPDGPDGPDGDVWFSSVPDGTPGAVPALTWIPGAPEVGA